MSDISSSGKKLYSILKEAWNEDGEKHIVNVWVKVLGGDASNLADISVKLGQLIVLLNEVRNDIKDLEISNIDKFLKALDKIQIVILSNQIFSVKWGIVKAQITEETLDLIDACGDLLAATAKGLREVSPIELEELQEEIRDLQDEIRDSDIEKETKIFLINKLRKIEELILNYRIRGSSGLAKVSEEVSGGILIKWAQMSEKAREWAGKVITVAIKTNSMISVAERFSKLPEGLKEILPLLLPGNGR